MRPDTKAFSSCSTANMIEHIFAELSRARFSCAENVRGCDVLVFSLYSESMVGNDVGVIYVFPFFVCLNSSKRMDSKRTSDCDLCTQRR